jgi:hypothetical protein
MTEDRIQTQVKNSFIDTAMNHKLKTKPGLTLTEMVVVIATISLLVGLGLPAVRAFFNSFESQGGGKTMISAALSSARAIAAKEQRYAGIRFQQDLAGNQYMVFIVHDFERTGLNPGFRAVEGLKPIKLPDSVGVMDLRYRTNPDPIYSGDAPIDDDTKIDEPRELRDTTTFSIVFSPSGKLIMRVVRVRNKHGYPDTAANTFISNDDVFNKKVQVDTGIGMFYQDDYAELGLGAELGRNRFVIYDKTQFDKLNAIGRFNYLNSLELNYINPYTGTIISAN